MLERIASFIYRAAVLLGIASFLLASYMAWDTADRTFILYGIALFLGLWASGAIIRRVISGG